MSELSINKLEKAKDAVNADPAFRKLGNVDVKMALKEGDSVWLVTLAGFSCHDVQAIDSRDIRDASFLVDMTSAQWKAFLKSGESLVDLDRRESVIKSENLRKELDFLRYHLSVQAFFDACAGRVAAAA